MFVFGAITATNMAADQAETQMNPRITCLQTVFATIGRWSNLLYLVQMRTIVRHHIFPFTAKTDSFGASGALSV
jgi:hypothetical protein